MNRPLQAECSVAGDRLKRGASPRATDTDGCTALMHAADSRSGAEVIATMVRAGANVDARDKHGSMALM